MRFLVRRKRRTVWDSEIFFDFEDGLVDQVNEGVVLCPVCSCCSLKRVLKTVPDIFTQAKLILRGEDWVPMDEETGWVCARGCTKTERHKYELQMQNFSPVVEVAH